MLLKILSNHELNFVVQESFVILKYNIPADNHT